MSDSSATQPAGSNPHATVTTGVWRRVLVESCALAAVLALVVLAARAGDGGSPWTAVLLCAALLAHFCAARTRRLSNALQAIEAARQAGEALAAERERSQLAMQGTLVGTFDTDLVNDRAVLDDSALGLLGHTSATLPALSSGRWKEMAHPDDLPRLLEIYGHALATPGEMYVYDLRLRHADGHWVWIGVRGNVISRASDGRPLRMVGLLMDVTARKVLDRALEESEAKFRSLFDLSPAGISLNDMNTGRFLQVNDALVQPTGYTREELLRMSSRDISSDTAIGDDWARQPARRPWPFGPFEKECRRRDGSTYSVLLSGSIVRDALGRDVCWSIVQDISQRKALESQLADAAQRDKLTGLANRAQFMERLHGAVTRVQRGEQRLYAVLFLDFDRFKLINDTLGHEAGDELLRQIARRLQGDLRASDSRGADETGNLVSRFGGDEFLILINDLKSAGDATRIAERLLNTLTPVYHIMGSEVLSTASVGIVTSEQCQTSAEDVVRNADVAMYEAKRLGRACSVVFNEEMHTRLTRHVAIETSLRRAIGTSELYLVYQPIVELATGRMVSAEALVRWNHPTLGTVSPAEFIPIAEESSLIIALGQWVLKEACQAMAAWRRRDPEGAPQTISVNVSRAELALGSRLLSNLRGTLDEVGLPVKCLQLEVTEREVMRNPEASLELMRELQRLGVRIAMDDFGTGTSSLGFLRDYPFNTIKIDRSFVKDLTGSHDVLAVIHATINLVENLGMASLAEGVEEAAQVAILQSLGCRYAQGYYFSRPVPAERLLGCVRVTATPAAATEAVGG